MTTAAVIANPRIAADLGNLGQWLKGRDITVTRLTRDDILEPEATDAADVLIVLGSIWTLAQGHRTAEHASAIDAEVELVRRWVLDDRPMLGICFGGQVLSMAMGGSVERMMGRVIAWELPDTTIDELAQPWPLWHEDRFSVPSGVELLASTPHAPMAIRTHRAWGTQFHPEFTADIMRSLARDIDTPAEQADPMIGVAESRADLHRQASHRLFDAWWSDVTR